MSTNNHASAQLAQELALMTATMMKTTITAGQHDELKYGRMRDHPFYAIRNIIWYNELLL
jgi:hypothetical protein